MMKAKPVILLSSVGDLAQALRHVVKAESLVICLDEPARRKAQMQEAKHIHSVGEYLDLSETELRERADEFSRQWYQVNDKDYSIFEGLSAGELFTVEVAYKALFELEKMIVLIQKIMQVHEPSAWILATNENPLFAQVIQAHPNQTSITQIQPNLVAWIRRNINFHELKLWLRREGWDYHFRTITFRLLNSWRQPPHPIQTKNGIILFILDIPTSSAMGTLLPVIKEIPPEERMILATDPRCYRLLQENNLEGFQFSPEDLKVALPRQKLATSSEIRARWKTISTEKDAKTTHMVISCNNLWEIRTTYFKKQFLRKIPIALAHFQLALAVIKTYQVRAIVSAADNHYMGQLFVRAAQKNNLYFLSVQHGMVNHPSGYLPIRASQLAVMGEAIREWLIEHGAAPEQVVVTGQPRFDALVNPPAISRGQLFGELNLNPDLPTWLIAPEPQLGLWMRDLFFQTLQLAPGVQAIIRVHPNDNPLDYQVSLNTYPALQERVRISRHHDIKSALDNCDAILLGRSTIGLEALIIGKYPITIYPKHEAGWVLPPYLREYLEIAPKLGVTSPICLLEAWTFIHSEENKSSLETLRRKIIHRYACNNDGKNAQRVAQLLQKEARLH